MQRKHVLHAILLKVLSTICVAGNIACVKLVSAEIPVGEVTFFRGLFALPALLLYAHLVSGTRSALRVSRIWPHCWRAILGCTALFCYFASIAILPLSSAAAINYLSPVMVAFSGLLVFSWLRASYLIGGTIVGSAGVWLLLREGMVQHEQILSGVALGLMGALLTALATLKVRELTKTETSSAIAFYFSVACCVFGSISLPFAWQAPTGFAFLLLVGSGLFSAIGHIAMTEALARSEPAALSPFDYLILAWAVLAEMLLLGRTPEPAGWIGLVLIAAAVAIAGCVARMR